MHLLVFFPCSCMHFCCSDGWFTRFVRCWIVVDLIFQHADYLIDNVTGMWIEMLVHLMTLIFASTDGFECIDY